jgi:hypothetical protein
MRNRRTVAALLSLVTLTVGAAALTLAPAQPEHEITTPLADHPAAKMIGLWRGTGSSLGRADGRWVQSSAVERAHWNLAGTAIIVEGYGYHDDPNTGERIVGHDALGVIEWDEETGAAAFHARAAGQEFKRHTLEILEESGQLRWGFDPTPGVTLRFTVTLTDTRWHEIGEMSRDGGATWSKFLETELTRVQDD